MISCLLTRFLLLWTAVAPFSERGKTDFDTFLQITNPYGSWVAIAPEKYGYKPFGDHVVPFTQGHWVYSDFGWCWQGDTAYSWAAEHYGTWQLTSDQGWVWKPGTSWVAAPVDFRGTKTHIGWRPSMVDRSGDFIEPDEKRIEHPEEWIFVPREKFASKLTPADCITGAAAKALLEQSQPEDHVFVSYRQIDRTGPDPVSIFGKSKEKEAPVVPVKPLPGSSSDISTTLPPTPVDTLVTMSLPTFYTPIPPTAKKNEIYVYRPDVFQDNDGIQRRIKLWLTPPDQREGRPKIDQLLQGN